MEGNAGKLEVHRLWSVSDMSIGNPEPQVDLVIREFLRIGEAIAPRQIQMPGGILLLQMVPDDPQSGAIYLYDRQDQVFYLLSFEERAETLTVDEFHQFVDAYDLLRYLSRPELLHVQGQLVGSA